jgi:hypothetical protein
MILLPNEMGSTISKISDDYKEYVELCKSLGLTPLGDNEDFYGHFFNLKESIKGL